jgi:hypothetical protein
MALLGAKIDFQSVRALSSRYFLGVVDVMPKGLSMELLGASDSLCGCRVTLLCCALKEVIAPQM